MSGEIDLFSLSSTYVVLGDNGDAIPVAMSDRFFEDLEYKEGDFKGKRLISHFTFLPLIKIGKPGKCTQSEKSLCV